MNERVALFGVEGVGKIYAKDYRFVDKSEKRWLDDEVCFICRHFGVKRSQVTLVSVTEIGGNAEKERAKDDENRGRGEVDPA